MLKKFLIKLFDIFVVAKIASLNEKEKELSDDGIHLGLIEYFVVKPDNSKTIW